MALLQKALLLVLMEASSRWLNTERLPPPLGRHQLGRKAVVADRHVAVGALIGSPRDRRRPRGAAAGERQQRGAHERAAAGHGSAMRRSRRRSAMAIQSVSRSTAMAIQPPVQGHDEAWKLRSCLPPMSGG